MMAANCPYPYRASPHVAYLRHYRRAMLANRVRELLEVLNNRVSADIDVAGFLTEESSVTEEVPATIVIPMPPFAFSS